MPTAYSLISISVDSFDSHDCKSVALSFANFFACTLIIVHIAVVKLQF